MQLKELKVRLKILWKRSFPMLRVKFSPMLLLFPSRQVRKHVSPNPRRQQACLSFLSIPFSFYMVPLPTVFHCRSVIPLLAFSCSLDTERAGMLELSFPIHPFRSSLVIILPGLNGPTHYAGLPIIVATCDIQVPDTARKLARFRPHVHPRCSAIT